MLAIYLGMAVVSAMVAVDLDDPRPNVLFIAVDDLRPDLGCYGNLEVKTPAMDALAAEGVVFERAYCQQSVCLVSRMSLMSGLSPVNPTFWNLEASRATSEQARQAARRNVVSLTEQFRRYGYKTIGFGKIYDNRQTLPNEDIWDAFDAAWLPGRDYASAESRQLSSKFRKAKKEGRIIPLSRPAFESAVAEDETFADGYRARLAIETLQDHDFDTPLFLAVGFSRPHLPFVAPRKYWDLYNHENLTLAERRIPPVDHSEYLFSQYKEIDSYAHPLPIDEDFERTLLHGYYACVSYIDAQIGHLIESFKALGQYENTLVVLWSDHGFKLGDFGEWAKHTNLEIDTGVPLLIRLPQGEYAGRRVEAIVELLDLLPTTCEAAGLPTPESAQGQSLVPLMAGKMSRMSKPALSQYPKPNGHLGYSIRTDHWRYHETRQKRFGQVVTRELYDLSESLTETINVLAQYPEVAKDLAAILDARLNQLRAGGTP